MYRRIQALENAESIYIYGYSNLGRNAFHKLKMVFSHKVKGFVVTKQNQRSKTSGRTDIYELEDVLEEKKKLSVIFVVAVNTIFHKDIIHSLVSSDCCYMVYDDELNCELNAHIPNIPKIETKFLALSVGQACNYRCRDCANFVPYALKENKRYLLEDIKKDIRSAMMFFKKIDLFHIQGGEPFLYNELDGLIQYVRQRYGHIVGKIVIATNGSIIPDDSLLKVIKDNDVEIRISDYKNEHNKSALMDKILENHIRHRIYRFADGTGLWRMGGGIEFTDERYEVNEKVNRCKWNCCFIIENGKIGRCARSIPASTLQNFQIAENDYIELRRLVEPEQIWQYFSFIRPMTCCRHCQGSFGEEVEPAIQLED